MIREREREREREGSSRVLTYTTSHCVTNNNNQRHDMLKGPEYPMVTDAIHFVFKNMSYQKVHMLKHDDGTRRCESIPKRNHTRNRTREPS